MSETSRIQISDAKPVYKSSLKKLEYNRKRYQDNRQQILEYGKKYVELNREKVLTYKRNYHIKNKDKMIDKATKWNRENQDRRKEITARYRSQNVEITRAKAKITRARYKRLVIGHYSDGDNRCNCCGESIWEFLTIDHINGGGNKHRTITNTKGGHHFYFWLIKNKYPQGFQVLCYNCNLAKGHYGYCPHRPPESTIMPL